MTRDQRIDDLLEANNRFEQRAREAERVCKAIAEMSPHHQGRSPDDDYCVFCETDGTDEHKPGCLWLRAKAIAEAPKHG